MFADFVYARSRTPATTASSDAFRCLLIAARDVRALLVADSWARDCLRLTGASVAVTLLLATFPDLLCRLYGRISRRQGQLSMSYGHERRIIRHVTTPESHYLISLPPRTPAASAL